MTRVAFVGTGPDPENPSTEGFAMAYKHAQSYERIEGCELVGCADIVREHAEAFASTYDIDERGVYEDYEEMVLALEPDVVSICTPPATHADLVVGCAETGVVDAIHCEKPMALTWGGSRRMAEVCTHHDVKLTFNHMRRFGDVFRDAKARIDSGEIGDLVRIEYAWGNLYDNGTHAIDLCNYFNDEHAAEWVIGQLDYREEDVRFGTHNENQVFASWEYENGVFGVASTGAGEGFAGGDWRLVGTDGAIEVDIVDKVELRIQSHEGIETVEYDGLADQESCIDRAIADVVRALREDDTSELCAENALNATEIIFAGYESVRRRGRVDLPLTIDDNPLESMVDAGVLSPGEEGESGVAD
jgi:predicted dehydrogenase